MPTYDYECAACGGKFEKFQSITAPSIRKCPSCGKLAVRRLIGAGAGIIFKGGGFYQTDYRSESYRKAAASDKSAGSSDSAKTSPESKEGSSESKGSSEAASDKPAAKPEKAGKHTGDGKPASAGKSK
jgi:putative FmdB family regulatory protein